ncbi:retrovirus-related pol polyprotein from transposon TNT 1-94, partial [Tanacetum coccineum]
KLYETAQDQVSVGMGLLVGSTVMLIANTSGTGGNYSGQQRIVKCFNCQREGHMARQCPKPIPGNRMLSYTMNVKEQRLEDVLGPFQKHFEALVNAESLDKPPAINFFYVKLAAL